MKPPLLPKAKLTKISDRQTDKQTNRQTICSDALTNVKSASRKKVVYASGYFGKSSLACGERYIDLGFLLVQNLNKKKNEKSKTQNVSYFRMHVF